MKNKNKEISFGYKDSPLGVIPQEWEVKRLGEIVGYKKGFAFKNEQYKSGGVRIIRISDTDSKGVKEVDTPIYLDNDEYAKHSEYTLHTNDIVVQTVGSRPPLYDSMVGKTVLISDEYDGCLLNQNMVVLYPKEVVYNLLFGTMKTDRYIRYIESIVRGNANQVSITLNDLFQYEIIVPPLAEQQRIAAVLGCWDEAIERQGRMVSLLTTRKRALMQRLLTPQPHWQKTKLGEIAERITRKNTENNTNVMTISAQRGFVSQTEFFNKSIASEILDNYFLVHKDEFCYNKSYCNGYPMGAIKRLNSADKAVVTTLYICFRVKIGKYNIEFFEQYFEAGLLNRHLMKIANEGGRAHGLLNVTPSDFFAIQIAIPPLAEQKSIAEKLSTADAEIDLARRRLDLLRTQKRALMQQLLTGKKRIKK